MTPSAGVASVAGIGLLVTALSPWLTPAAFASSASPYGATAAATISWKVEDVRAKAEVTAVTISRLTAGNDATVKLQLWGNATGDPAASVAADSLLSTADSSRDACTQAPLKHPLAMSNGSVTLPLCPKGGPAGYVSVHDLVRVVLFVNGSTVSTQSVLPGGAGRQALTPSGSNPASGRGGTLVFTGFNAELWIAVGMFGCCVGLAALLLSRRGT